MASVSDFSNRGSGNFRRVVEGFLLQPGLPFAEVLSAERVERSLRSMATCSEWGRSIPQL